MSLETRSAATSAEFLESARLAALERYNILDTAPEKAFERITTLSANIFSVPIVLVTLIDKNRAWFKSCYGLDTREADRKVAFCTYTIQTNEVMVVLNALNDPRFAENPLVSGDLHIRFYAGAPLKTSDGYNLGSLCLLDTRPHVSFDKAKQGMLADLAAIVVDELELRNAGKAVQASETKLRTVIETIADAIYIKDLKGRYTLINHAGAAGLGHHVDEVLGKRDHEVVGEVEAAQIVPIDEHLMMTGQPINYERSTDMASGTKTYATSKYPYYAHDGTLQGLIGVSRDVTARRRAEQALANSEARYRIVAETASDAIVTIDEQSRILYANGAVEKIFGYSLEKLQGQSLMLLMPDYLRHVHEAALRRYIETGVRHMHWEAIEIPALHISGAEVPIEVSFGEHHENGQRLFTGIMRDITERKRTQKALETLTSELESRVEARTAELAEANAQLLYDAFHDSLTSLANRALFSDRLALAVERYKRQSKGGFTVLYLDTDRFKNVNDSFGHTVGDKLLIALGKRLQACVRPGDTVARFGGDEFVILLEDAPLIGEATHVAERIQHEVRKPFALDGKVFHTSVSIGIVVGHMGEVEEILRDADIAMYQAKALGKARYQVFTEAMRERATSLIALENGLRSAIARNELRVHYQPIKAIQNGSLTGFEALVRWQHPTLGVVSPASFIPLAEETGLIIKLDRWVLREACRQLKVWQLQHPLNLPLTMNVNLSSRQFLEVDLVECVQNVLLETGIRPEHLKLEVTESVLMQHEDAVMIAFEQLKALGVKLYIDDFGTGYSSLSYLQRFPVDTLKIDRSFVDNMVKTPESAELVKTIIAMAQALNLSVVAEGIETEAQLVQLNALGCSYGQGYLFAKPLTVERATAMLHDAKVDRQLAPLDVPDE